MKTRLTVGILAASLSIITMLMSCIGPIPDTGKPPIINPDEVIPVVPKPVYPPPPPEINPYARQEPRQSDNSQAVLSERAKEQWDRLLAALEKDSKPPGAATSANSTSPKVEPTPPSPAPVVAPPNPVPVVPPPAQSVNSTAPQPSATPALTAARDLTGTWKGNGAYYYSDIATGRRIKTVTVDVTMKVVQKDNTVTADMSTHVIKQEPPGDAPFKDASGNEQYTITVAGDENVSLRGTASATTLNLTYSGIGYTDLWTFTFTTDLMSGGVRTQMSGTPFECKSDPKAYTLTRQR